jgi:glycosyltransferase involved in cell wall biosynthesis
MTAPHSGGIAILSSASGGGAGIAAKRLSEALRDHSGRHVDFVDGRILGEYVPQDVAPQVNYSNQTISDTHFTFEHPGFCRGWLVEMLAGYDVVNVHWSTYLTSLAELEALSRRGKPMIFTLHDFHWITGGCHYPATCDRLAQGCLSCPQLDRTRGAPGVIARNLRLKREIMARPNVHVLAPSQWLRDIAVRVGAVPADRAHVLRNPYAPLMPATIDRDPSQPWRLLLIADSLHEGRKQMRLALDALAAFFGARDPAARKVEVDIVGQADEALLAHLRRASVPHVLHGRVTDHGVLSGILARADVLLTCSNEDNWPNILVEAGVYGCIPVVGPGHGCEEFVNRYGFGHVAQGYSVAAFHAALLAAFVPRGAGKLADAVLHIREDHAPARIARSFSDLVQGIADRPAVPA